MTTTGFTNAYYQPPATIQMEYPCVVYWLDDWDMKYADNKLYIGTMAYSVTLMEWDPDGTAKERVAALPLCSFDRHYTAKNLHHTVFLIYY